MPTSPKVSAVLLAAGRAERFGGGKLGVELAPGLSVLGRSLLGLLDPASGLDGDVWLVGHREEIAPWLGALIDAPRVHVVEVGSGGGQGDSLAAAASAVPAGQAVLVALGDQPFAAPFATAAVLERHRGAPGEAAVAAALGGRRMPPALFAPSVRPALERLSGDQGGRVLLESVGAAAVELGEGDWAVDLDRPEELARLRAAAARDAIVAAHEAAPA
jgi:molybdenum cofactor cytidylyltransferase